ncbi:hypothetical protein GCG54_00013584 [Colletotrichum gloeosporioides]|uniref:Uncharacterized protein n=1 Tax=Colletotrichum gloeosporioides TaxID=474922 RepID=A0A8H4FKY0_COLGL|nr:uncharacterized protein GCG54_00013584 [Colletotrichum gloeosporioides]KAF3805910.1 hypothetical protein GCG54_00013584 [Colletotrichum gloeosporioides]KAI8297514.1 hypothetical protein K4K59_003360 [Colletotrichum sp. SAR11_240]
MSTSAVATATSSGAAATSTAICSSNLYDTPIQDSNCAMPYGGNHTDIMKACCKDADVVSYYDNCGIYCLAIDQTVAELTKCLFDNGAPDTGVFCRGNVSSSATATGNSNPPASAGASIVASGGGSRASASGSGSSSSSSSSANAAPGAYAPAGVSTLGMTIGALLLSAATFGALQI